jgi:hypothetical protein
MPLAPFPISHKVSKNTIIPQERRGQTGDTNQDLLAHIYPFPSRIHPIRIIDRLIVILSLTPQECLRGADAILGADERGELARADCWWRVASRRSVSFEMESGRETSTEVLNVGLWDFLLFPVRTFS